MKIALVGGGTGGHFYPLIAVVEAIEDICEERRLLEPQLVYISPMVFDTEALFEHSVLFKPTSAGRVRRYASALNILDIFRTAFGIIRAIPQLFSIYPDVIFSTGGYAAFPTLVAARILAIPVIIYDADARPGRVSLWSSKFAKAIAVAHPEAAAQFPEKVRHTIARTGHPIRKEILGVAHEGGYEFLHLDSAVPTVLFMGGSQGARALNEVVLDALPELLRGYNVVHQTGKAHIDEVTKISSVVLRNVANPERYRPFGLLNTLSLRMAAGAASVIVARAGSGTIFEIASWGIPAILVPIPQAVSHDQTENAFSYSRSGAAVVIEQHNLTPHLLAAEIDRLMGNAELKATMEKAAKQFARPDAARKIARMLLDVGLEHEPEE
ncbi:MAG: UDP diphospho-muramoyl pentapeptide beta-N acetylglucosaminyl transferase [Candidatus Giovannonibacteria bacterium GW2011_GWA2_53_7]|uniref:UDP-N-acetylglucosamine--N-acetylmuramyl-(pentapeptide) pyrophosphoryl-undecaprenol N-acetylglucosamine transferase n=1 Tax=Candidatus Giovannonibacteria bacterium GW2011_GWA2_53_7 TaxID=1618650 RepID=A0A0G1XY18_9BACT|nr:MAG: UDP diphospho-muramoyl pentapeptide beta-N acetylglucosaminyl transferase [Candidatus Giovannonibacteria bacterium GW2011_GWA2_53_7]